MSKKLSILLLIIIPLLVTRQWFLPGLPQTHDAEVHISRAAVMARSLKEGNLLPRWAGYFNWRYGTPSIMFLYPGLPYLGALIHLASGWSFIGIYKMLMVVFYIASGWLWYLFMKGLKFSPTTALVSALFYLLAPYRLVDIFVRGALAEHVGFVFAPLMLWVMTGYLQTGRPRWRTALALSVAGVILFHNLSALLYIPLVLLYPLIYPLVSRQYPGRRRVLGSYLAVFWGFTLSAFFWVPALVEARYTLASWLFSAQQGYRDGFLAFRQLVWSPWGYGWSHLGVERDGMSFQVGIIHWLMLFLGIGLIWRRSISGRRLVFLSLGLLLAAAGMVFTLPVTEPVWKVIPLMQKFQFPWRFLSWVVIGASMVTASVMESFKRTWFSLLVGSGLVLSTVSYWQIAGPSSLTEHFLTVDFVGTSDTGETTPRWAVRFQEKFPEAPVQVVSSGGRVEIGGLQKTNERHEFMVVASAPSRLVDNTLYFPGWKVYVDDQEVPIEYQDRNWRGLITFPVQPGEHRVEVVFEETLLRKIANMISVATLGVLMAWLSVGRKGV